MQNRRIINQHLADAGVVPGTAIESNSIIALVASVASGHCMAVLPTDIARFLSSGKDLHLIPLEGATSSHAVGLVVPHRDPRTPVLEALFIEAKRLSKPA